MLKPENRLKKLRDFNLLFKHGHWVNGLILDIKALELAKFSDYFPKKEDPNEFKKQLKLAFNVGLKISKSAVKRNRARRLMREAVRLLMKEKDGKMIKSGFFALLNAKKDLLDKNLAEISQEVLLLLNRAGMLNKEGDSL